MDAAPESLERAYRQEATRIRAALAARTGDLGLAEDAVQDAFVEAIEHWPRDGVPASPGGWLATTAHRKALDRLRRDQVGERKLALLAVTDTGQQADDELLSLVFGCCHPALARDAQVALTLRAVCGLTVGQIARAFLVSEATMSQRLLRARKTLADAGAPVRVPDPDELADRLAQVLAVVYLFFNEGYLASSGRQPARRDLAVQAVALTRTLHRLMPREPEVLGLLALLLLHESRAAARFDGWGRLIRLKDQDRSRWDGALAAEATRCSTARSRCGGRGRTRSRRRSPRSTPRRPTTSRPTGGRSACSTTASRTCRHPRWCCSTGRSPPATRSARSRRWPRSSPCAPISRSTTCSTRSGPPC